MAEWRFPSNDYGENKGINDSGVAMFRGTPLKSLAREICQNSLDASNGGTTVVEFNMFKIDSDQLPGKEMLIDAFKRCLSFWNSVKAKATKEFFTNAIKDITGKECTILRISDFNTTGLTGSREPINTDWTNLTKSSGASDKKGTAGGSFGIGKYAPFACSSLSTVFYSTYDIHEEKASQGVARLVTFTREDEQNTQGTGYYGNEKNTPIYEEMILDPEFSRKPGEYGTDIYIAGYKYGGEDWQKELLVSILDGFLGAVWNKKLEVIIGDIVINRNTLDQIIEEYRDDLTGYTENYYNVLISEKTNWYEDDFFGLGKTKLGILLENQDCPNRISMIRQTGMKIMDRDRLPGHIPYMGVMFINGDQLNEELRAIENPEHTKWEPDRASNPAKAKQLLKALNEYIKKIIENLINEGDGESIDAVGVGVFLPDDEDGDNDSTKEDVISDKVLEVEINPSRKRKTSGIKEEKEEEDGSNNSGHMEPEGDEEAWFHHGGNGNGGGDRPPEPAHREEGGDSSNKSSVRIDPEKFICMCIDKSAGKYMIRVSPNKDGLNGEIHLYLSAETQRYEAPIKKVTLIGGEASFEGNIIKDLVFEKGKEMRLSIELDYYDYCSVEVMMRADQK